MPLPRLKTPLRFSTPLFVILLSTLILAVLLSIATIRNVNREQKIMEAFLLDEGLTLIRSFEAGARTTMRHEMMWSDPPIVTLVRETVKTRRIAFITIVTADGHVVAQAGSHNPGLDAQLTSQVLTTGQPVTMMRNLDEDEPVFEVAAVFKTLPASDMPMMNMMGKRYWHRRNPETAMLEQGRAVIHIGLRTGEFLKAREADLRHSLFMGLMLVLLGSAGLYFLFLYQKMLVTKKTLDTMRLYTNNIIASMPDGLMTLDARGRIVSCNPRALELTGLDLDEMLLRTPQELFPRWPSTPHHQRTVTEPFSHTFVHENTTEVPVEITVSPLLGNQGERLGAVLLLRDLRQIRAMEEQLARSRHLAALGKLAAGIAHEIRNPLGTLRGFAQYFGSRCDDDASREYSRLMVGEVDRLNQIISSLLQFSRPRTPHFSRVDMTELLKRCKALLEHDFSRAGVKLSLEQECEETVEADGDLLLQVMLNLLKNALQASSSGDHVTVTCICRAEELCVTVRDEGAGMDDSEKEQMFDPFFTTKKDGTGLGLAVSHQIIQQHGGRFTVVSRPGQGTTITFSLPLRQKAIFQGGRKHLQEKRPAHGTQENDSDCR